LDDAHYRSLSVNFPPTIRHLPRTAAPLLLALAVLLSACSVSVSTTKDDEDDRERRADPAADPAAATALPEGFRYPAGDSLRVATWNVEHFVDQYDDPYIDADREDEPRAGTDERVGRFVEAVRRLDADVLVLQEFESAAFAERLADERFPDMNYRFFAGTESRDWYMNVVLMSRVPLGVVESYAGVTTPIEGQTTDEGEPAAQAFTNNRLWSADVLARPGYTFTLAGLHLKAGRGARNAAWRTGQIRFLRHRLSRRLAARPDANLLVAGDFNSLPDSPELQMLLGDGDAAPHLRLIDPLAGRQTFTHPADDPERQLDYILVNEQMRPELVRGSVRVASPLAPSAQAATSDHLPVVATIVADEQPADS
jgi:endonuclease/exonuclease/phosphatase family metal-dependent hydrolase